MPSSDKHMTDDEHEALLAKIEANKAKHKAENPDRVELDYAALSAAAMNRHTTSPEFTARYKKWLRGWAPKGRRCRAAVPHGHWKTITFVGGLTLAGVIAPMLIGQPMDGEIFLAWCEQMLAPALRPGDIVIMDNLPAHKVAGIRDVIEARGATLLYLPPYSPDFNPIENAFAKLKAHVRKYAARTIDALEAAAADALRQFKPAECANFFSHAGYGFK
jgi:transposase